jgi:hypothetical protein
MNEQVNILIILLLLLTSLTSCSQFKHINIKIYKTIILPVLLCGCEIWCLTLRKEHGLSVFKNNFPRRTCGFKRDEIILRLEKTA